MSAVGEDRPKIVRYQCNGLTSEATYEVSGRFLVVTSHFGAFKTMLGLQQPRRLAKRLLQNICARKMTAAGAASPDKSPETKRSIDAEDV